MQKVASYMQIYMYIIYILYIYIYIYIYMCMHLQFKDTYILITHTLDDV